MTYRWTPPTHATHVRIRIQTMQTRIIKAVVVLLSLLPASAIATAVMLNAAHLLG